jgi:carboxymethylenebutenolidase
VRVILDSYDIEAEDGMMPVTVARPVASGSFPGIVVLMEAYGLNDHIRSLTHRLAEEGFVALSPDLHYRQPVRTAAYDDLPTTVALVTNLWDTKVLLDTRAVLDHLAVLEAVRVDAIGVVGFSMGGRIALLMAAHHREIAAAAIFYGGFIPGQRGPQSVDALNAVGLVKCPVLGNFAAMDEFVPY